MLIKTQTKNQLDREKKMKGKVTVKIEIKMIINGKPVLKILSPDCVTPKRSAEYQGINT
jgi:hypothetical protein